MHPVITAFGRALRSLSQPSILWHLIWPTLVAIVLWGMIAWHFWDQAAIAVVNTFNDLPWLRWIISSGDATTVIAAAAVKILLWLMLLPLVYATALIIVATFALPLMLERVGDRDYAELEKRRGGTIAGSVANALLALAVFLVVGLLSLPLWLIPGFGLAIPLLLSAYLNQRAYRYDALMQHADREEIRTLIARERGGLYLVGIGAGLLAYVPFVNLLAPAFAGLAFVHYCLEALRRHRARGVKVA